MILCLFANYSIVLCTYVERSAGPYGTALLTRCGRFSKFVRLLYSDDARVDLHPRRTGGRDHGVMEGRQEPAVSPNGEG